MTTVEIVYCVPCDFLERAESVQHALLSQFGMDLEAVTLRTGDHGVFTVSVDGQRIFDKADDGFDLDEITRRVRARL